MLRSYSKRILIELNSRCRGSIAYPPAIAWSGIDKAENILPSPSAARITRAHS